MTRNSSPGSSASAWGWAVTIFIGFFILYLATPTSNHTFDALSYAQAIHISEHIGPEPLFHPHHLLFSATGWGVWHILRPHFPNMDPLKALQVLNAFGGALGLVALFFLIRHLVWHVVPEGRGRRIATFTAASCSIAVGFTFAWWVASTDGRVNILPMTPVIGAFYFAFRTARRGSPWTAIAMGLSIALATLLHQSHGLFLLVALAAAALAPKVIWKKIALALAALASFAVATVLPYAAVLRMHNIQTLTGAFDWMTTYARLGIWWNFDILGNLDQDFSAQRHAFLADVPEKAASFPAIASAAAHAVLLFALGIVAFGLVDRTADIYREYKRRRRRVISGAVAGAKGGTIIRGPRCFTPLFSFNFLIGTWIISYAAFFTIWSPGYFIFWLPVLAALTILLTVNASANLGGKFVAPTAMLAAACFLVSNLWLYVLPNMPPESNGALRVAEKVKTSTPAGSLIITTGMGDLAQMEVYIPYFAERQVISVHEAMSRHGSDGPRWLRKEISNQLATGRQVYIFGEVFNSPKAWQQLKQRYGLEAVQTKKMLRSYQAVKKFNVSDQPVYLINP